jgi:hypothetical protein
MANPITLTLLLLNTPLLAAGLAIPTPPLLPRLAARRQPSKDCSTGAPGCSCTEISFAKPGWEVKGLTFRPPTPPPAAPGASAPPPPPPADQLVVSFSLANIAAGYDTPCASGGDKAAAGGDATTQCAVVQSVANPGHAQFRYDALAGALYINQSWSCSSPALA